MVIGRPGRIGHPAHRVVASLSSYACANATVLHPQTVVKVVMEVKNRRNNATSKLVLVGNIPIYCFETLDQRIMLNT